MIIKIQAEDGQDFIICCNEGTGGIAIATANCQKLSPDLEHFTIEETVAIVGALTVAIKLAEQERDMLGVQ